MNLDSLFTIIEGLIGDISVFQGLAFYLEHGVMVIDYVKDFEYPLVGDDVDIVDGFIIDFVPFNELQDPTSYFALDEEGIKAIISDFILK
ncbi:hypothetical protein [Brevibacillus laterosporus]|uniref:hypothetical protein n=1 Tax=Brevibacillus laterosporus TaxID=1465 RepID=UPI003D22006E